MLCCDKVDEWVDRFIDLSTMLVRGLAFCESSNMHEIKSCWQPRMNETIQNKNGGTVFRYTLKSSRGSLSLSYDHARNIFNYERQIDLLLDR